MRKLALWKRAGIADREFSSTRLEIDRIHRGLQSLTAILPRLP